MGPFIGPTRGYRAAGIGALLLLGLGAADGAAQEIGPFRLMKTEGYLSTSYFRDEFATSQGATGQAPSARSHQSQSDLREEFFLMTHSYVYHPNLLTLDIGGGPILQYGTSVTDTNDTQSISPLYNLTARATFLREKPYRGSVFYDHLNPTLSVSPGQVVVQENERYGFDFALLAPLTPVPFYIDASRTLTKGRGADRIIDDRIDRVHLRANRNLGSFGSTEVQFQTLQQESHSGSPNLPIQGTRSETQSLGIDSRLQFGASGQYEVVSLVNLSHQTYTLDNNSLPDRYDIMALLDARLRPRDWLQAFGLYSYTSSDQGAITSQVHSGAVGLSYWPIADLTTTIGAHGDINRTDQVSARTLGGDGSIRYQRPVLFGVGQVSYVARYDQREQQAGAPQANVLGERLTLTGTTAIALARVRVIPGSVVVSNATRTQTFAEGGDYSLIVVGLETRVQRVFGGNIVDGQDLLVDYAYDTGRTFAYTQLDQTVSLGWSLSRYLNLYYRHSESWPQLTSGTPSSPLNTVRSDLYGAQADIPLKLGVALLLGGGYEREDRRETIAPYRRETFDLHVQNDEPFLDIANLRLAVRRTRVDYGNAAQNVDLLGSDVRFWLRHPLGIDLVADASWERDTGGLLPRSRMTGSVKAQWRYRQVTLTLDFGITRESEGPVDRTRKLIQFMLRRDF